MPAISEVVAQQVSAEDIEELSTCVDGVTNPALQDLLQSLITHVKGGFDVSLLRSDAELTPNQVAAQLQMSRGHVYKLIDRGHLPCHRVGRDRRVRLHDVLLFEQQRQRDRRELAERFAHVEATRSGAIDELLDEM